MSASQIYLLVIPVARNIGIYLCLTATSTITLLMRGLRGSTARQVLFCVVLAMFLSSTGTLVSDIMARLRLGPASIQVLNSESDIAQVIFIRINFLLSDYVVIWRCWSLWDSVLSVRLLLAFCVMVSTVAGIVSGALLIRDDVVFGSVQPGPRTLIMILPIVSTNIFSTSLVAYKAWQHRRHVRENLGREKKKTQIEKVLILFVESGVIYCVLGVLALVSAVKLHPSVGISGLGAAILSSLQPHLAGIYPTAVILLVTLEKTQESPLNPDRPVRHGPSHVSNSMLSTTLNFAVPVSSREQASSDDIDDARSQTSSSHLDETVDRLENPERVNGKINNESSQKYV